MLCGVSWAASVWTTAHFLASGEVGHFVYRQFEEIDNFTWNQRWVSLAVMGSWPCVLLVGMFGALAGSVAYRMQSKVLFYAMLVGPLVISLVVAALDRLYGHPMVY
jgi:hypothetical protein